MDEVAIRLHVELRAVLREAGIDVEEFLDA